MIALNLKRSGFDVIEAADGAEALELFARRGADIDIAVLDIMMPAVDGIEVCRQLRAGSDTVGIIMLTAKTQEMDKVQGLLVGADDYITKPFSISELLARVDSVYRRVSVNKKMADSVKNRSDVITLGEFTLDIRARSLRKNGAVIDLTQVEFQIIEFFFTNPDTVLTRESILRRVWGDVSFVDDKVVDVNIRRLRMKIESEPSAPKYLRTVWGHGYKWVYRSEDDRTVLN